MFLVYDFDIFIDTMDNIYLHVWVINVKKNTLIGFSTTWKFASSLRALVHFTMQFNGIFPNHFMTLVCVPSWRALLIFPIWKGGYLYLYKWFE